MVKEARALLFFFTALLLFGSRPSGGEGLEGIYVFVGVVIKEARV